MDHNLIIVGAGKLITLGFIIVFFIYIKFPILKNIMFLMLRDKEQCPVVLSTVKISP